MAKKTGKGSGKAYRVDSEDVDLFMPSQTRKVGRPTKFSPKIANVILAGLSEGMSLRKICREHTNDPKFPDIRSVMRWMLDNDEFSQQYARAKEQGAEAWAEEILEIADDGTNDYVADNYDKGRTPGYRVDGENIQRSKLRVDTRKWLMAKMKPKKYGDKLDVTSGGDKVEVAPIYGGLSGNSGPADTRD